MSLFKLLYLHLCSMTFPESHFNRSKLFILSIFTCETLTFYLSHVVFLGIKDLQTHKALQTEQSAAGSLPRENGSLGQVNTSVTLSHKYIYTSLHINRHTRELSPSHMHTEYHSNTMSQLRASGSN